MGVWLKEWSYPSDGEFRVTVWSSEHDAFQSTISEIQKKISRDFDMDDEDQTAASDEFDLHVSKGRFKEAIQTWNNYQDDHNSDYASYFTVREADILTWNGQNGNAPTIPSPPTVFKATTAGATCRKCNDPNPYAYADKADGTYCCRQCSVFSTIFGTKP